MSEVTHQIVAYENRNTNSVVTIHTDMEDMETIFTVRGIGDTKRILDSFDGVRSLESTLLRGGYSRYTIYDRQAKRERIKRRVEARLKNKHYGIK